MLHTPGFRLGCICWFLTSPDRSTADLLHMLHEIFVNKDVRDPKLAREEVRQYRLMLLSAAVSPRARLHLLILMLKPLSQERRHEGVLRFITCWLEKNYYPCFLGYDGTQNSETMPALHNVSRASLGERSGIVF